MLTTLFEAVLNTAITECGIQTKGMKYNQKSRLIAYVDHTVILTTEENQRTLFKNYKSLLQTKSS